MNELDSYAFLIDRAALKALDNAVQVAQGEGEVPLPDDEDYPSWVRFLSQLIWAIEVDKKKADH